MRIVRPDPLRPLLEARGRVLLDGGLATALEAGGHLLDTPLWSAALLRDDPGAIAGVHTAYLEAGAECIGTATYQASVEGFTRVGVSRSDAEALMRGAVALATEARATFMSRARREGPRPLVAASLGPYGAFLADGSEYDGRYGVEATALEDFHGPRFELVSGAGADLVAFETIPSGPEAEVVAGLVHEAPDVSAWISFSCRDGGHLWDGTPIERAAEACVGREGVVALGVNCVRPDIVASLIRRLRAVTELPLAAYPNSGERYDRLARTWRGASSPDAWLDSARTWVAAGARLVGGCCRVGPDLVRRLGEVLSAGAGR